MTPLNVIIPTTRLDPLMDPRVIDHIPLSELMKSAVFLWLESVLYGGISYIDMDCIVDYLLEDQGVPVGRLPFDLVSLLEYHIQLIVSYLNDFEYAFRNVCSYDMENMQVQQWCDSVCLQVDVEYL